MPAFCRKCCRKDGSHNADASSLGTPRPTQLLGAAAHIYASSNMTMDTNACAIGENDHDATGLIKPVDSAAAPRYVRHTPLWG